MTNSQTAISRPIPRPTAQVAPYVTALGPELAVQFLLAYGGAELYIRKKPSEETEYAEVIGVEGAKALAKAAEDAWIPRRVPLAKGWLIAMLDWQGCSVAEIARQLRISDVSVRKTLKARAQNGR